MWKRPSVTWSRINCLSDSNEIKDRSSLQKDIGEGGRFRAQRPNWLYFIQGRK